MTSSYALPYSFILFLQTFLLHFLLLLATHLRIWTFEFYRNDNVSIFSLMMKKKTIILFMVSKIMRKKCKSLCLWFEKFVREGCISSKAQLFHALLNFLLKFLPSHPTHSLQFFYLFLLETYPEAMKQDFFHLAQLCKVAAN